MPHGSYVATTLTQQQPKARGAGWPLSTPAAVWGSGNDVFPFKKGFQKLVINHVGSGGELHTKPMRSRTWIRSHAVLPVPFTSFSARGAGRPDGVLLPALRRLCNVYEQALWSLQKHRLHSLSRQTRRPAALAERVPSSEALRPASSGWPSGPRRQSADSPVLSGRPPARPSPP